MGYIGNSRKLARKHVGLPVPGLVISDASGSRVVLQHARAVAHGTRADDLVARTTAPCAGAIATTVEVRRCYLHSPWGCVLAHVGTGTDYSEAK